MNCSCQVLRDGGGPVVGHRGCGRGCGRGGNDAQWIKETKAEKMTGVVIADVGKDARLLRGQPCPALRFALASGEVGAGDDAEVVAEVRVGETRRALHRATGGWAGQGQGLQDVRGGDKSREALALGAVHGLEPDGGGDQLEALGDALLIREIGKEAAVVGPRGQQLV